MSRHIIIGTGITGISAAEAIRDLSSTDDITLITDDPARFYSRPGLAYYLVDEVPEKQLYSYTKEDFENLNATLINEKVTRINKDDHSVTLGDGRILYYDKLLIATGSSASLPSIPDKTELKGIVKLDTIDDAKHIRKLCKKARAAIVIGGGITALELVEGFLANGVKTHYFLRRDRYWGKVLDETESRIIEQRLKEEGVLIHYHTEIAEITEKEGKVTGVHTKDGKNIRCDIIAYAIGIRPNKKLAEIIGIETERGILVDEYMKTSIPDIYAAGDVAQVYDPYSGNYVLDSLWGTARLQGRVAGQNMSGKSEKYTKDVPFNVTRLAGLTTTIIGLVGSGKDEDLVGIARGDSETWRQLPDAIVCQQSLDVNHMRILIGDKIFLGAIVMGDQTFSKPLYHLIARKADISEIKGKLLEPDAPIADILALYWIEGRTRNEI